MSDSIKDPFIRASRQKLRLPTSRGHITVEDLWDLSLTDLDDIALALDAKVNTSKRSFIGKRDRTAATEELQFEIVKAVINTKMEDAEKAKARTAAAGERAFLAELLDKKRTAKLEDLSEAEIKKRIKALGDDEEAS